MACWGKLTADRNTYSTFMGFDANEVNNTRIFQTENDGTNLLMYPTLGAEPTPLTVGTWYYIAAASTGAQTGILKVRAQGAGAFTTKNWTQADGDATATFLRLGESIFGGEWLNGCIAAVKLWHGTSLTATELEAEYQYRTPLKTTGITCYYTFDTASTVDNSGNGRTLTGGVGATTEAGPTLIDVPGAGGTINGWGRVPIR
jgi:hypothetical protein